MSVSPYVHTMGAFFNSFRKGPVVCRGLDLDLSGKVAKKNDSDTEKRSPRPQCVIAAYEICHGARLTLLPLPIHTLNVAIVTRSHFGNAKPKFHMNCWPTISINDQSCQQRCRAGPANFLTCTYSFIFTIYKSTGKQQRNAHPYSYLYAQ